MGPHIGESFGIDLDAPAHASAATSAVRMMVRKVYFLGHCKNGVSFHGPEGHSHIV